MPAQSSTNIGPIYLYDGSILHKYPNILFAGNSDARTHTPRILGMSMTLRGKKEHFFQKVIIGRKFFSPLPIAWLNGNLWAPNAMDYLKIIASRLFTGTLVSEGVTYVPAVLSDALQRLVPIEYVTVLGHPTTLRRRRRQGPWTAEIDFPQPFPTPTG